MDAQKLYVKGVKAFGEECDIRKLCDLSRSYFEKAVALDKYFARAHGWLAYVLAQGWYHDFYDTADLNRAKEHAKIAVELDEDDFENHWSLGEVEHRLDNLNGAHDAFRNAIRLNPNEPNLIANWAEILNKIGEQEKALTQIRKAISLMPVNTPDYFYLNKAYIEYFAHRHTDSLESLDEMASDPVWATQLRAANLALLGLREEARKNMKKFLGDSGDDWTLPREHEKEASMFRKSEDGFLWLLGLYLSGMKEGEGLPADIIAKLKDAARRHAGGSTASSAKPDGDGATAPVGAASPPPAGAVNPTP